MKDAERVPNPDAELLRLVDRWRAANDAVQAYPDAACATDDGQTVFDGLCGAEREAVELVRASAAATEVGMRAKADVLRVLLHRYHKHHIDEDCIPEEIDMALSLCRDLIGEVTA